MSESNQSAPKSIKAVDSLSLDSLPLEVRAICIKLENFEADTLEAIKALSKQDAMIASKYIEQRYNLDKQGLKKLFGVINKWDSMKNNDKIKAICEWPDSLPFFTKKVILNAGRRRDEWRYYYYSNQISELPESVCKLKNITELHLDYQELPILPESIGELESLEVLNLEDNKLKSLPESITRLKNLSTLKLKQNYGLELLPDFGMLPNLEVLDLSFTKVKTLPEGFFQLKNIKKIVTENCELDHKTAIIRRLRTAFPDAEIVSFCDAAIKIEDGTAGNEYMGFHIVLSSFVFFLSS
jgi:hypothetical protein